MKFIDVVILISVLAVMGVIFWRKFLHKKSKSHCENCKYSDCKNRHNN